MGIRKIETNEGPRYKYYWTEYLSDGNKTQHTKGGFILRKDAAAAERASRKEHDDGHRTSPNLKLTVGDWLKQYAADRKGSLGVSTAKDDQTCINRVLPLLGEKTVLRKLERADIDAMVRKLREPGANKRSTLSQVPLAESTISRTFVFLSGAFKEAVRQGKMNQNPCTTAKKPRPEKHIVVAWSVEELNGFLAQRQAAGDRLLPLWRTAGYTGLRRSELLGLMWTALDLNRGYLAMVATGICLDGEMTYKPGGKSDSAVRRIDLDPETVEILRAWKEVQELEVMAAGGTPSGLVFTDEEGTGAGIRGNIVGNRWRTAVRESGLRRINFKDLRSTHGTILTESGAHPKMVQERLGHSSASFSMDRYTANTPGMQAEAARIFSQAMGGGAGASVAASEILALLDRATPEVQAEVLAHLMAAVAVVADGS